MSTTKQIDIWTEKYKPQKVNELTTNTNAIKSIYSWLLSYDKMRRDTLRSINNKKQKKKGIIGKKADISKSCKSCMLVTGGHGVGKSTTIDIILKELNYKNLNS